MTSNTVPLTRLLLSAVGRDVDVMRLAASCRDFWARDLYKRLLEPRKLILLPLEQPSERRQLHAFLLESTVGKK